MDVAFLMPEARRDMNESAGSRGSFIIARVLLWQLVIGTGLAAALWGIYGRVVGYSALLGCLICVVPNAFLALRLAVSQQDPGARSLVRAAYIGETGKLALTVLFFSLVFVLVRPLSAVALFAGFIATQLVTFSGLLMRGGQQTESGISNGG